MQRLSARAQMPHGCLVLGLGPVGVPVSLACELIPREGVQVPAVISRQVQSGVLRPLLGPPFVVPAPVPALRTPGWPAPGTCLSGGARGGGCSCGAFGARG